MSEGAVVSQEALRECWESLTLEPWSREGHYSWRLALQGVECSSSVLKDSLRAQVLLRVESSLGKFLVNLVYDASTLEHFWVAPLSCCGEQQLSEPTLEVCPTCSHPPELAPFPTIDGLHLNKVKWSTARLEGWLTAGELNPLLATITAPFLREDLLILANEAALRVSNSLST